MKKIIFTLSLLLTVSFMSAQYAEKENLKQNEAAASRKIDELPNGWKNQEKSPFYLINRHLIMRGWQVGLQVLPET